MQEDKVILQRGNTLQLSLRIKPSRFTNNLSSEYVINENALFQIKFITSFDRIKYYYSFSIRFEKARPDENQSTPFAMELSSKELGINNAYFTDDGSWRLVYESFRCYSNQFLVDINVRLSLLPNRNSFATLYDDDELIDFKLRAEDGSIPFHKAVLAASSPVLRQMLGGIWKELNEGRVDVPGTSKNTLQHLKEYIYNHTIPDTGLEQMLLLSSYYSMPDLEVKCVKKLVSALSTENAVDLLKFAVKYNLTKLVLSVLKCVQNGEVDVGELSDFEENNAISNQDRKKGYYLTM